MPFVTSQVKDFQSHVIDHPLSQKWSMEIFEELFSQARDTHWKTIYIIQGVQKI